MIDGQAVAGAIELLGSDALVWVVIVPGLLIGLLVGAIPGLTGSMGLALLLPMTVYMDFLPAVLFITATFTGAGFGSSVPSILMGLPGSSSAVAASFDGFPMTKQGRHNEALGCSLMASVLGMLGSYVLILIFLDFVADAVLQLGPLENLLIVLWGLTMIASLSGESLLKGLVSGFFGILLGTVGISLLGVPRGTLGISGLNDGIPAVPALMGFLAISGLYSLATREFVVEEKDSREISMRRVFSGMFMALKYPRVVLRGSVIGMGIGALPGVGSSIANLLAYSSAKKKAKDPETFGKGNPEGVIAADAANSSSEGGSMATLMALGLPGGGGTALLLSAFTLHGVTVGPRFIGEHKDFVYALIFSNLVQGLLLIPLGVLVVRAALVIVAIPLKYLVPVILALAVFGTYSLTGGVIGPITLVTSSIVGWFMIRYGYSVAAAVIGLLLGGTAETLLIQAYQLTAGFRVQYLIERPVSLLLFALLISPLAMRTIGWPRRGVA